MYDILVIAFLIVAIALVGIILIQQGKGADMGSSFGAGSSQAMFGSSGSGNFLTKTTTGLAICFFILALGLGNLSSKQVQQTDEWSNLEAPAAETVSIDEDVPVTQTQESDVPN